MPGGGPFVVVKDTTHVGLNVSGGTAELLARWALEPDSVSSGSIAH